MSIDREAEQRASDQEIDAMVARWARLPTKWTAMGEAMANDCLESGLRDGSIVRYSEIKEYIESRHKYNASAIQYGFTNRMLEFVNSGEILNLTVEGDDIVFIHVKHADELLKGDG